jgi:hypothetical protein
MPKLKKSLWDDSEDLQPDAFADPDAALIAELEPFLGSKAIKFIAQLREFNTEPARHRRALCREANAAYAGCCVETRR